VSAGPAATATTGASQGEGASAGEVATRALEAELTAVLGGARHEARFIVDEALDEALDVRPGGPRPRPDVVPVGSVAAARAMAARRVAGEPLQYIFGHWPFRQLDLLVDPRVLIPRPETEQVVEVALSEARRLRGARSARGAGLGLVAVDAGTGSGAIALALATELGPGVVEQMWATDTSAGSLEVAAANLEACRADGAGALPRVELLEGSWLSPLPAGLRGHVDLVVSNPPYVTADEWAGLDPEVRAEPREALVAGPGTGAATGTGGAGLADVEAVLEEARLWLGRPGAVVVELAPHQAAEAQERARQLGYDQVRVEPDLAGRPRALVALLGGSE
jgi:release factor glutamine methyltransferase